MAISSKCPKCDHTSSFEFVEEKVKNARYLVGFIRCSYCGCVVGTTMGNVTIPALDQLMKKVR